MLINRCAIHVARLEDFVQYSISEVLSKRRFLVRLLGIEDPLCICFCRSLNFLDASAELLVVVAVLIQVAVGLNLLLLEQRLVSGKLLSSLVTTLLGKSLLLCILNVLQIVLLRFIPKLRVGRGAYVTVLCNPRLVRFVVLVCHFALALSMFYGRTHVVLGLVLTS